MTESMGYHRNKMSPTRMMDESLERRGSSNSLINASTASLLTREQQLREDIARLRREKQELEEKDQMVKQNIFAVREKMAAERRY